MLRTNLESGPRGPMVNCAKLRNSSLSRISSLSATPSRIEIESPKDRRMQQDST